MTNNFSSFDEVREYLLSGKPVHCNTNTYYSNCWYCHEGCCDSHELSIDEILDWVKERSSLEGIYK